MSPRTKSILLVTITLLIGVVVGALLNARLAEQRMERLASLRSSEGFVRYIERVVQPRDEAQRDALRQILRSSSERMAEHRRASMRQAQAILDSTRAEMEVVLSAEQLERLDEDFRMQQRRWERRDGRGGRDGPRGRGPRRGPPPHVDGVPDTLD